MKEVAMSLSENPFEWETTEAGKLMIYRGGKLVMIVSPDKAVPVIATLGHDDDTDQHVFARITGQYRMGNERVPGSKRS